MPKKSRKPKLFRRSGNKQTRKRVKTAKKKQKIQKFKKNYKNKRA